MIEEIYEGAHDNTVIPRGMSPDVGHFEVKGARIDKEPIVYVSFKRHVGQRFSYSFPVCLELLPLFLQEAQVRICLETGTRKVR